MLVLGILSHLDEALSNVFATDKVAESLFDLMSWEDGDRQGLNDAIGNVRVD